MRTLLRTFRELFLVPMTAAMLPWRTGFAFLARLARSNDLYAAQADAAWHGAATLQPIADPAEWKWRYRLIRLVDQCDMFLVKTRSARWLRRNVDVEGAWPADEPFLAMTFHWGAGMWSFVHLKRCGHSARMVVVRHEKKDFNGNWVAAAYADMRNGTVESAGGAPVIPTGGATPAIVSTLAAGDVVVALYDVPASLTGTTVTTRVCGRPIDLPAGLARIAVETGVSVVPFSMGIDYRTGRRRLKIEPAFRPATVQEFADRLAGSLTELIEADLPAWHFSGYAPQFFAGASNAAPPLSAETAGT